MKKILFITDLHLTKEPNTTSGIDTYANFNKILEDFSQDTKPELIVLGGDLCHTKPDPNTYAYVLSSLSTFDVPIITIPGNHDDSRLVAESGLSPFRLIRDELYGNILTPIQSIALDSSKGEFSEEQWAWICEIFSNNKTGHQIVFMHHPPVICGARHMEPKYQFKELSRFQKLLEDFKHIEFHIFCGHFHLEKSIRDKNLNVYVTPSTFVQIHPDKVHFEPFMPYIGYRIIYSDSIGSVINTHVKYV